MTVFDPICLPLGIEEKVAPSHAVLVDVQKHLVVLDPALAVHVHRERAQLVICRERFEWCPLRRMAEVVQERVHRN